MSISLILLGLKPATQCVDVTRPALRSSDAGEKKKYRDRKGEVGLPVLIDLGIVRRITAKG